MKKRTMRRCTRACAVRASVHWRAVEPWKIEKKKPSERACSSLFNRNPQPLLEKPRTKRKRNRDKSIAAGGRGSSATVLSLSLSPFLCSVDIVWTGGLEDCQSGLQTDWLRIQYRRPIFTPASHRMRRRHFYCEIGYDRLAARSNPSHRLC